MEEGREKIETKAAEKNRAAFGGFCKSRFPMHQHGDFNAALGILHTLNIASKDI